MKSIWHWLVKHKGAILNVITVAGPIVAGITTGPVGAIAAGAASLAGKLAASPIDHSATPEAKHVEKVVEAKLAAGKTPGL